MCVCVQGARGSGGVRLLYSPEEVELAAKEMIGDFLITKQTGAEGRSGILCLTDALPVIIIVRYRTLLIQYNAYYLL